MEFDGYDITRRGYCLICGTRLMTGEVCHDCYDPTETRRELWERVLQANPNDAKELMIAREIPKEQSSLMSFR